MATFPDIVTRADQLRAGGREAEAIALLDQGVAAGDAAATFRRAIWCLAGIGGARDLPRARALLADARRRGDADAAAVEIALTANGTGGAPDWPGALTLLDDAARTDEIAAAQRDLLRAMALTPAGAPQALPAPRLLAQSPRVQLYPGLLTQAECVYLIEAGMPRLQPGLVTDPRSGRLIPDPIRTSDVAALGPIQEDLVLRAINLRLAAASGTSIDQGEPLNILRYQPGQQYRLHSDALPGAANQRRTTLLVYLNQGYLGGETRFPALNISVTGRTGDALLFDSLTAAGTLEPRANHVGEPVRRGVKWLATRWIRARRYDPWNPDRP